MAVSTTMKALPDTPLLDAEGIEGNNKWTTQKRQHSTPHDNGTSLFLLPCAVDVGEGEKNNQDLWSRRMRDESNDDNNKAKAR